MSTKTFPTLNSESVAFTSGYRYLLGIDEVGRGALSGPVAVGIAVIEPAHQNSPWPAELRDSKLLTEPVRERLFEPVAEWVTDWAVGFASHAEIDEIGIVPALRLAGRRAFEELSSRCAFGSPDAPTAALLDGSHNWLAGALDSVPIRTQVKADRDCVSVAAASVLAKVSRDRLMIELSSQPDLLAYDFASNKGYSSAAHLAALRSEGPSQLHRLTWLGKILG